MFLMVRKKVSLLCTVLLLLQGGVAPVAHASAMRAADTEPAQAVEATVAAQTSAMPCHGQEAAQPEPDAGSMADPARDSGHSSHGQADCCHSVACQCACVHASLAAPAVSLSPAVIPDHPEVLGAHLPVPRARVVELFKPPI